MSIVHQQDAGWRMDDVKGTRTTRGVWRRGNSNDVGGTK